jgi:hypothetical protein
VSDRVHTRDTTVNKTDENHCFCEVSRQEEEEKPRTRRKLYKKAERRWGHHTRQHLALIRMKSGTANRELD